MVLETAQNHRLIINVHLDSQQGYSTDVLTMHGNSLSLSMNVTAAALAR